MQTVVIAIALGAMAAAQAAPPAPPAPPAAPAPPAPPASPKLPKPPRPPAAPAAPKSYSYLGVDIREVTPERASALKLKEPRGAEITLVDRDAPAGKAGLKEHDVILSFNGRNLQSGDELRKLIRETPPGRTVDLGISRDGQPMTVKAQLADKHSVVVVKRQRIRIPRVEVPIIATFSRRHGVVVENLTPQLGEVFGVKNGDGVLVRSVEKGSAGEAAGLRAGDVIVRVGSERVEGTSDWNRLMREQKPGPVQVGIVRDKRQQSLSLSVPEPSAERSSTRSFRGEDFPDVDIDLDMEEYARGLDELNRIQPEIDRAMRETQERVRREVERSRREGERARRQAQRDLEQAQRDREQAQRDFAQKQRDREQAQREAQREQEQAQREAQRAQEQAQREADRAQQQAQREVEQAQREAERAQRDAERQQQENSQPEKPPPSAPQPPPN
jgi:membrane-associated protease RseP (regulator of RpoE activity)